MEEMQTAKDIYLVNSHFISLTISETVTIQTDVTITIITHFRMFPSECTANTHTHTHTHTNTHTHINLTVIFLVNGLNPGVSVVRVV